MFAGINVALVDESAGSAARPNAPAFVTYMLVVNQVDSTWRACLKPMWELLRTVARSTLSALKPRGDLALENLELRQQLAVLRRDSSRPQLEDHNRMFWIALKRVWPKWQGVLQLVQPATVIRWHRAGFRFYWRRKSPKEADHESIPSCEN